MKLLELFWSFVRIGYSSFGAVSMIPIIEEEMLAHGWMTAQEVMNLVAIAEMTPGSLGLNCATFAGLRVGGTAGALTANLGVIMPALTIGLAAAVFFENAKNSEITQKILFGVRPVCVGLLLEAMAGMGQDAYLVQEGVFGTAILIGAVALGLLLKRKWTITKVLGLSALLGVLLIR